MNDEELQELLRRAGEMSKAVPEALQEAAFNRAVDLLTANLNSPPLGVKRLGETGTQMTRERSATGQGKSAEYLLTHLDRTSFPEISSAARVLDRSLHLLRVARDSFEIDGLGAPEIARILTEKFRLRASRQAVQQALDAARNYVDKVTANGRAVYRIMRPGETYLESLDTATERGERSDTITRNANPRPKATKKSTASKAKKKSASGSRPGPRATLNGLLQGGYFDSVRRIGEIQQYLADSRGHSYKLSELSPTLVRMIRDDALERNRADDGQYEYKRK